MTDQEQLEAVYAGMAMLGFIINGDKELEDIPELSKKMARKMMEEPIKVGLPAIKRKRNAR